MIMDYNRVVKDLNGLSVQEFLGKMESIFDVEKMNESAKPTQKGELSMFLDGSWYRCTMHKEDIPDFSYLISSRQIDPIQWLMKF